MTKLKKILLVLALCVCCISPVFTGCGVTTKLTSPVITLFDTDNCIAFQGVAGTTTYDIYCNDKLFETYENEKESKSILYNFSNALTENGKYEFYVVAVSDSLYLEDSDPSNTVELNYTKTETPIAPPISEDKRVVEFSVSADGVVAYTPLDGVSQYTMYLYSNTTGLNSYSVSSNVVNLKNTEYSLVHEIYAIRLGYTDDEGSHMSSEIKYYNPDKCSPYTDNIYIFDGLINDYYISSINELNNIMYYSYIDRNEDFNIKFSPTMKTVIEEGYDGDYFIQMVNNAVNDAIDQYFETQAYKPGQSTGGYVQQLSTNSEYNIKVSYYGVKECDVSIPVSSNEVYTQGNNSGYYDTVDYTMLGDDYNDFVSDKYFLYTTCSTSEELYWAVENKITPVVVAGSRADVIYKKAKEVLRDIISEEMTDYEKTLAIFDWISLNTNYDYTDYDSIYRGGISLGRLPMYLPCFYLEGVFMTGYAVCDGFSKAYSLMCNMLGIDAIRIVGTAITNGKSGGHAWNKVYVDKNTEDSLPGQYYLVDITWTEIISAGDEVLSHLYFLLGDDDVKDTHFDFEGRVNKFGKYVANDNYFYYDNHTFTCVSQDNSQVVEYDWVIESNKEMKDLFYYTLHNSLESVEYVVDIDYMIDYYEYINGVNSYRSSNNVEYEYYVGGLVKTKYEYATDTLYAYSYVSGVKYVKEYKYYKLREEFIESMRNLKFKEQYFTIIDYDGEVVYNENGDLGVLYIIEQNLCINETSETEHLISYLGDSEITGNFNLYVEYAILENVDGSTPLSKLQNLISEYLDSTDMSINISYDGVEEEMYKFKFTITEN